MIDITVLHSNLHQKNELCWRFLFIIIASPYLSLSCHFAYLHHCEILKTSCLWKISSMPVSGIPWDWNVCVYWHYFGLCSSILLSAQQFPLKSFLKSAYLADVTFTVYLCAHRGAWLEASETVLGASPSMYILTTQMEHKDYQMNKSQQITSDSEDSLTDTDLECQWGTAIYFGHCCYAILGQHNDKKTSQFAGHWGESAHQ